MSQVILLFNVAFMSRMLNLSDEIFFSKIGFSFKLIELIGISKIALTKSLVICSFPTCPNIYLNT